MADYSLRVKLANDEIEAHADSLASLSKIINEGTKKFLSVRSNLPDHEMSA